MSSPYGGLGLPPELRHFLSVRSQKLGRKRYKRPKPVLKGYTYMPTEVNVRETNMTDIFLGASDIPDYITSRILADRESKKVETFHREFTLLTDRNQWRSFILSEELRNVDIHSERGFVIDDKTNSFVDYQINSSSILVKVYGDSPFVINWYNTCIDRFEEVRNIIEWVYNSDGANIEIPVRGDRVPVQEMYPFLDGEPLGDYYDRFMRSSASILLLIGPPGTGKTTFIRGLLQHAEISAIVTYDTGILSKDHLFAQFIEGSKNAMIIEDADNFLGARTNGNDFMHKFLNVGDGLVTTKNKKMIFSTNLPSIRDIDSALLRPGRCFDVVTFDLLTQPQAEALAKKVGVELDGEKDKWSIADIFHKQVEAPKSTNSRKFGFV